MPHDSAVTFIVGGSEQAINGEDRNAAISRDYRRRPVVRAEQAPDQGYGSYFAQDSTDIPDLAPTSQAD
ncbi:MAG: hypothetical protein HOV77_04210 [Hamadaea sp.]|uniref:hypothetical protein n=1 Tax=Hamadaea sp. TaxID=2024425 RepID=UPI001848D646|nr:hypothetical protein [Hamadaea sp.]NUT18365.1 hypothetical protein [Hamadaea sp.]